MEHDQEYTPLQGSFTPPQNTNATPDTAPAPQVAPVDTVPGTPAATAEPAAVTGAPQTFAQPGAVSPQDAPTPQSYTPNFTLPQQEQQWSYAYAQSPSQEPSAPSTPPAPPAPATKEEKSPRRRSGKGWLAALMVLCVLLSGVAGFVGSCLAFDFKAEQLTPATDTETPATPNNTVSYIDAADGMSYAELAAAVSPTVVQITTEYTVNNFWMQQTATGAGSGVIISSDGTVVTNHHVVEDANSVKVILSTGEEYPAELVATDAQTDIAVLKIEATDLPCAVIGDSDELVVGQEVIAVGNPLGELGGTVTNGIISAVKRTIFLEDYTMSLIQTNTAINPGNSGGGLFDASGKLIGIVNAKYSDTGVEGLGFAIPINTAMHSAQDLIDVGYVTGRISVGLNLLGIYDQQTAFQYRVSKFGVYVYSTVDGSSAEKAGFKTGDLILSIDGVEINSTEEIKDLFNGREVGESVTVRIERNDEEMELDLVLTEYMPDVSAS